MGKGDPMVKAKCWFALLGVLVAASCGNSTDRSNATDAAVPPNGAASPVPPAIQAGPQPLFVMARSTNANVVHYDAQLTANGDLDPEEPVIAYWIMLAEDGHREDLTWLEKRKAYGFTVVPDPEVKGYTLTIAAVPERKMTVRKTGGVVHAELVIDGHQASVERIYIESAAGLLAPSSIAASLGHCSAGEPPAGE
jgi:hypothetical protein